MSSLSTLVIRLQWGLQWEEGTRLVQFLNCQTCSVHALDGGEFPITLDIIADGTVFLYFRSQYTICSSEQPQSHPPGLGREAE